MKSLSFNVATKCVCVLAVLLLTGCTTGPVAKPAPQGVMPIADLAKNLPPYRIQVGDFLEVKLILNPELNEEITVRPDGMISTAVVQDVLAYGRTPKELQEILKVAYKRQLSDPQLTVVVRTFAPTRVYVLGEVGSPGELVSVGPNLTLMQALARAGGVKESAETSNILILRRGAGENPEIYSASYDQITKKGKALADVRLAAYDVVFVSRSAIAEANVIYDQYVKKFISPSVGLSYQLNPNRD